MDEKPHTIISTERAWAKRVLALLGACGLVVAFCAHAAWPLAPIGILLIALSLALYALGLRPILRGEISVGIVPIALAAVGPAALAAYLASGSPLALAGALLGTGTMLLMCVWFARMIAATKPAREPSDADVAIVLGCAVKDGHPSATLACRLDKAYGLWARHPGMRLVVSGGISDPSERSEAAVMAAYLADAGIPAEQIIPEDRALNTEENLAYSLALIERMDAVGGIVLITSDYHLWRATTIARDLGIEAIPCAAATPLPSRLVQWCREVLVIMFGS
ncbi:YdcF family protein [Coriobacteriales bacterium OH1046]|nr:YdcF family protein [Coriobacteriales bacterium OH1046]